MGRRAIAKNLGKSLCDQIVIPLVGKQITKVEGELDTKIVFRLGVYARERLLLTDKALNVHLDSGGNKSPFRGTTQSQDAEIMKLDGTRLHFDAISRFGFSVIQLDQAFKDYPEACYRLTGKLKLELFPPEVETIVPRPIPPSNIEKMAFLLNGRVLWSSRNPKYTEKKVIKILHDWKNLYESLKESDCFEKIRRSND